MAFSEIVLSFAVVMLSANSATELTYPVVSVF